MSDYTRGTVWGDGQALTAQALNQEFDRIQAVINGGLELTNFQGGEVETAGIINAGAPRFDTGGLERAERIANAVAEAAAADIKVVWVPRAMFGYVDDSTYAGAIFDTTVLMVREGQIHPGHDVVAYGALPDDATVNDTPAFDNADAGAAAAAIGANPGAPVVMATLPGEYQLDTSPAPSAGVGFLVYAGVTFAGAGDAPDHAFSGIWSAKQEETDDLGSIASGVEEFNTLVTTFDMSEWALVYATALIDEDAGSVETRVVGSPGQNAMAVGNVEFRFDRWLPTGGDPNGPPVLEYYVDNVDSVAHDVLVTVTAYFIRKS